MNIFEANTKSPVTVSFDEGTPMTIKMISGNNIAVGGFVAGMIVMGIAQGAAFRLLNDQTSTAVVAAAEDAADRAEAAASAINFVTAYGTVDLAGAVSAQSVIEAAVAWSYANDTPLFWPAGTYLSTASIPHFHDVTHEGPGVVKRGSHLWHITPPEDATVNHVYAAASGGSSKNDGLSASEAIDSFQGAIETLEQWAPLDKGQWQIDLLEGTHTRGRFPDEGLPSSFPIIVAGPRVSITAGAAFKISITGRSGSFTSGETITFSASGATATLTFVDNTHNVLFARLVTGTPVAGQTIAGGTSGATATMDYQSATPLASIKEGATQSAVGILGFYTSLRVRDVEIEDYNGSTSSNGVRVDNSRDLFLENVHLTDCYHGASVFNHSKLDVKGGFAYDNGYLNSTTGGGYAYRGVFHAKFDIGTQNGPTVAAGPAAKGNSGALRAQELSTGHLDWSIIADNDAGIRLLVGSRLNVDGTVFLRNTASAMYGTQGSHVDVTDNTVFGTGASANGRDWSAGSASTASAAFIDRVNVGNAANPGVISNKFPALTINSTGNTAIDTFTVSTEALNDTQFTSIAAKKLTARITGTLNGTIGAFKGLVLRAGGTLAGGTTTLISFEQSATGAFEAELSIFFKGPNSQRVVGRGHHPTSAPVSGANITESTSADMVISLEGLVNNAADSIVVESVEWIQTGF
ncbi:hypothetical protein CN059_27280 [Sinorhizobium medicae]|uniref:Right handed beta helix domain-containing protein n=1 Tax=Sinorhizobium medicae TaxID=110321 RepID=A0ABX4TAM1_9HYPH|nr:hypothetical protein [Sinorhizobium medicae]MDX1059631.1 hypothetical protein [Sinorhizobium medicae]PLT91424.1 hypothetical protein BMJ33_35225 [Sinorhizobium medicae]PLU10448.1 hypothetical protein BMJ29_36930 [Sinorhizobium medicae]PLU77864.1 hypothetical protein BMJ19_21765 [Sinorhizobium medicae]RVQ42112.1 hypothetical protein CN059_27280 [Sinorhizobium medicae]